MVDVNGKTKKVEQGDATREALLAAARELFGRHGYAETSLDGIVQAAGVTKGAFYHHFSGKAEIFLRVLEALKKDLSRAAFVTHVRQDASGDVRATSPARAAFTPVTEQDGAEVWRDLLERCRRYIELHTDPQVRRIVLLDARSVLSWEAWNRVENEYGVVLLRADLRRLTHRRLIRPLPLHALAMLLAGALNEACMLVANAEDPSRALDEAMAIIERFLEGLRMPAGTEAASSA